VVPVSRYAPGGEGEAASAARPEDLSDDELLEMRGAARDLTHELGRYPLEAELAARLGVSADELSHARQAADGFSALSLDTPAGDGENSVNLGDLLGASSRGRWPGCACC
jgi:DNA-directed RNA polymerase specialized sigma subunit